MLIDMPAGGVLPGLVLVGRVGLGEGRSDAQGRRGEGEAEDEASSVDRVHVQGLEVGRRTVFEYIATHDAFGSGRQG